MVGPSWVLTGAGLISAAGDTPHALFETLGRGIPLVLDGRPTGAPPEMPGAGPPTVPIAGFDPKNYLKRKGLKDLSRTSQLACAAASRLSDALASVPAARGGVAFGSAWGSLKTVIDFERAAHKDGPRFVDPLLFTETVTNVAAGQVSIFFGWSAFNVTLCSGPASGLEAIRRAVELLGEGRAELAVAGGGDELSLPILRALLAAGAVATTARSFPYGEDRSGPIGGEGACLLVVESLTRARARGAIPKARIRASAGRYAGGGGRRGAGLASAAAELLREVLESAEIAPGGIDLLVLSGSGSQEGDAAEAAGVQEVFGADGAAPPAVAPKGILGEVWAASGPIGVVAALEAMRTGTVPGRPRGLRLAKEMKGLNLPEMTLHREVRRALVLDCAASGYLSALVLEAIENEHGS